ncbi:MAG TPA: hypothetical protein PLN06_01465 [Bacteroidales bacterium]|nr:hypothetical protein [Bacteroidales bacterium]HOU95281.1 hypothetical protein [Bacteroidales bacterium]HQG35617.1 hypothetical protein [Bacteroidales bacterium]HQG51927.1 hypothetical protein [Bacteroidales bacterium]HQJ19622.1 hypothetical protein [Bacteroidales bacterium]
MKKTLFIAVAIALSITINAQKAALHSPTNVQLFTGVNAFINAYSASVSGDTIYLSGGSFAVPATIDKKLLIFGAGHYPDSTVVTGRTVLQSTLNLGENADGFHLEGIEINGDLIFTNDKDINNVTVKYCKINNVKIDGTTNPSTNLLFIRNVVNSFMLRNAIYVLISNNIIGSISESYGNTISNNIYLSSVYGGYGWYYLFGRDNNTIINNIFLETYGTGVSGSGNIFRNNLFVTSTPEYGTSPTESGNYTGVLQADIFVNQTGQTFNYTHDYHLKNPGIYIGTDGTQVGIYGGTYPYKDGGVPSNPHIRFENIAPTTNNGILNVEIKVSAQDN